VTVPPSLRRWFVIHFVVDVVVAAPLFVAPRAILTALGWSEVDPAMSRVVAAALFGIGIQSFLGRNEPREVFRAMLDLKLIWSGAAVAGIAASIAQGAPAVAWIFLATFVAFFGLWLRYRVALGR